MAPNGEWVMARCGLGGPVPWHYPESRGLPVTFRWPTGRCLGAATSHGAASNLDITPTAAAAPPAAAPISVSGQMPLGPIPAPVSGRWYCHAPAAWCAAWALLWIPWTILDRNIYQVRPRHRIAALLPSAAAACPILAACLLWLPDVSLSLPGGSAAGDSVRRRSDHGQRAILHGPIPAPRAGDGCPDLGGLMRSLGFALGLVPRKRLPETGHGPAWRPCCRLCRTAACPGWTPARSGRLVSPGYVRRPLGGFNLDTIPIGCR